MLHIVQKRDGVLWGSFRHTGSPVRSRAPIPAGLRIGRDYGESRAAPWNSSCWDFSPPASVCCSSCFSLNRERMIRRPSVTLSHRNHPLGLILSAASGRPSRIGRGNESLRAKPKDSVRGDPGPVSAVRRSMRVRHPAFGEGSVETVEREGDNRKITVCFPGYGRKKILVRPGKMEFLS